MTMEFKSFDSHDDMFAFLEKQGQKMWDDFQAHAEQLGLDPSRDYDFICLSYVIGTPVPDSIKEKLAAWPVPVRGYWNEHDVLCLNIPMDPEEENDLYAAIQGTDFFDYESANFSCWRVDFPSP